MEKLIRDKYDKIIDDEKLTTTDDTFKIFTLLKEKISEEIEELFQSNFNDVDEYADIIEVLYAMASFRGIPQKKIDTARLNKLLKLGGFKKRLIYKLP